MDNALKRAAGVSFAVLAILATIACYASVSNVLSLGVSDTLEAMLEPLGSAYARSIFGGRGAHEGLLEERVRIVAFFAVPFGSALFALTCLRESRRIAAGCQVRSRIHPLGMLVGTVILSALWTASVSLGASGRFDWPAMRSQYNAIRWTGIWIQIGLVMVAAEISRFVAARFETIRRWRRTGVEPASEPPD